MFLGLDTAAVKLKAFNYLNQQKTYHCKDLNWDRFTKWAQNHFKWVSDFTWVMVTIMTMATRLICSKTN